MSRRAQPPGVGRRPSGLPVIAQRGLVVVVVGAALAVLVVGFVSTLSQPGKPGDETPLVAALWQCSMVGFLLVGCLVARKKPRNPIGWCLLAIPLLMWTSFTLSAEVRAAVAQGRAVPAWAIELEWLAHGATTPALVVVGLFLLLGFPEGNLDRVGSRLLRIVVPVLVLLVPVRLVVPGPMDGSGIPNPHGVASLAGLGDVMEGVSSLLTVAVLVAGWDLIRRYRRSTGTERQQFRWVIRSLMVAPLAYTAATLAELVLPQSVSQYTDLAGIWIAFFGIAAGMGVSVLRYRLWDIDRVVSRTVSYGVVTVVLVATYLGLVIVLQTLVRPVTGESDVVVAASTLAVAALFQPLRRRVQHVVDRRFNRANYDAEQMVGRFASRLRDELDLDTLRAELAEATSHSLQPATQSLWVVGETEQRSPALPVP